MSCEPENRSELAFRVQAGLASSCDIRGDWTEDLFGGIFRSSDQPQQRFGKTLAKTGYLDCGFNTNPDDFNLNFTNSGVFVAAKFALPGPWFLLDDCPIVIKQKRGRRESYPPLDPMEPVSYQTVSTISFQHAPFQNESLTVDFGAEVSNVRFDNKRMRVRYENAELALFEDWVIDWPNNTRQNTVFEMAWTNPGVKVTVIPGCTEEVIDVRSEFENVQFFNEYVVLDNVGVELTVPMLTKPFGVLEFGMAEPRTIEPKPGDRNAVYSPLGSPNSTGRVSLSSEVGCTVPSVMQFRVANPE
jgi:hypothetical protein